MSTPYSRQNPSARHQRLADFYVTMHAEGHRAATASGPIWIPPADAFRGRELLSHVDEIKSLIDRFGSTSILDYGSGKGEQHRTEIVVSDEPRGYTSEYWNATIAQYEPAIPALSVLPEGQFDGVVSTDVLEHLSRADVPWIVDEMFAKARHFVFANVATYPAGARLPSDENAHETVMPGDWWNGVFETVGARYPTITYVLLAADGYNMGGRRFVGGGRS